MPSLEYDVVIATRNRPEVLRLSIPLLLGQTVPPSRLVVIDSSDEHQPVRDAVFEAVNGSSVSVVVESDAPSAAGQRNRGLEFVRSPVVFFPDDDSIFFPDAAAKMLRVYELDADGIIGAVCSAESVIPPPAVAASLTAQNHMRRGDRFRQRIGHARARFEKIFFPDPFVLWGGECIGRFSAPGWFAEENVVPVEYMTGFRMSFRTGLIRDIGFDNSLGRYSLFEDVNASFSVWKRGMAVVGARDAKIFHYKAPSRRTAGRVSGVQQILNRAFIIALHSSCDAIASKRVRRYAWYKTMQYLMGMRTSFGRDRLRGALSASCVVGELMQAKRKDLQGKYLELRSRCLEGEM